MTDTSIEWTDEAWNPIRGCTKISPGCKHCYAETFAERFRGVPGHPYERGFDLRLVPEKLGEPLAWRAPRRIFVNSMSDWLHEDVPLEYSAAMLGVAAQSSRHTYQFLTKRADRLVRLFDWIEDEDDGFVPPDVVVTTCASNFIDIDQIQRPWPLPNVWLGVSVEDRKYGLPRVDFLRRVPAAVRFLSIEPLLEDIGTIDLTRIGWVIVGGESGPGARPFEVEWARSIVAQCRTAGIAVFVKQLGAVPIVREPRPGEHPDAPFLEWPDGTGFVNRTGRAEFNGRQVVLRDRKGGDMSEWPEDLRVREFPATETARPHGRDRAPAPDPAATEGAFDLEGS